jgi:hypothetical protein
MQMSVSDVSCCTIRTLPAGPSRTRRLLLGCSFLSPTTEANRKRANRIRQLTQGTQGRRRSRRRRRACPYHSQSRRQGAPRRCCSG